MGKRKEKGMENQESCPSLFPFLFFFLPPVCLLIVSETWGKVQVLLQRRHFNPELGLHIDVMQSDHGHHTTQIPNIKRIDSVPD